MNKRHLVMTVMMGVFFLFGSVAWAHEVSVFDNQENLIIRAFSSTPGTDPTCTPGPYCVNLEVRDPSNNGSLFNAGDIVGLNDASGASSTTNPLKVHSDATTDDLSLAFDDTTGTTFLFCKNGSFMVMQYNLGRAGAPPVNGVCGASNGMAFYSAPSTNLCGTGTPSGVTGSGPWNWSCAGSNGGTNANCSASLKVGGVCGTTINTCTAGTFVDVTDTGTNYLWNCTGSNGGTTANCSLPIPSTNKPDLVVTAVSAPAALLGAGQAFNFSVSIKNQGLGVANPPFRVTCVFGTSFTYNVSSTHLLDWDVTDTLSPGQTAGFTAYVGPQATSTHTYFYVDCMVDSLNQIQESDETNNTRPSGPIRMM